MSESKTNLTRVDGSQAERWDTIVQKSPQGTIFHIWPWIKAMEEHSYMDLFGVRRKPTLHALVAEKDGRDIGLIPLFEFRFGPLSYVYTPPPHTAVTYQGPVTDFGPLRQREREQILADFHLQIEEYLKRLGCDCIRLRTPPGYIDVRPLIWSGYNTTPAYNYLVDLSGGEEALKKRLSKNVRKVIRYSRNQGYELRYGDESDLKFLYERQQERYFEQDIAMNITLEYLKQLWDTLPKGSMHICVAELDGEPVTSTIRLAYKDRISAWFGNSKTSGYTGNPNDLLHWMEMTKGIASGYKTYENIWANNPRLNKYKVKMNPTLSVYYSAVRVNPLIQGLLDLKGILNGGGMESWW